MLVSPFVRAVTLQCLEKVSDIYVSVHLIYIRVCVCMHFCRLMHSDLTHRPSQSCSWHQQWSGTSPSPAAPAMLPPLPFTLLLSLPVLLPPFLLPPPSLHPHTSADQPTQALQRVRKKGQSWVDYHPGFPSMPLHFWLSLQCFAIIWQ